MKYIDLLKILSLSKVHLRDLVYSEEQWKSLIESNDDSQTEKHYAQVFDEEPVSRSEAIESVVVDVFMPDGIERTLLKQLGIKYFGHDLPDDGVLYPELVLLCMVDVACDELESSEIASSFLVEMAWICSLQLENELKVLDFTDKPSLFMGEQRADVFWNILRRYSVLALSDLSVQLPDDGSLEKSVFEDLVDYYGFETKTTVAK